MGIYIEGLKIPKNKDGTYKHMHGASQIAYPVTIMAYDDGRLEVRPWNTASGGQPEYGFHDVYKAVEVPDHGRLIDADKMFNGEHNLYCWEEIEDQPTVIKASREET